MKFRSAVAALAVAAVALVGVAACSDSKKGDNSSSASSSAARSVSATLTTDEATKLIRIVLDPKTSTTDKGNAIDSPVGMGTAAEGVANGFTQAGYTPDLFTATKVESTGDNKATATINVKGPHGTADLPVNYVYVKGSWKLSADVLAALQQAAGGH